MRDHESPGYFVLIHVQLCSAWQRLVAGMEVVLAPTWLYQQGQVRGRGTRHLARLACFCRGDGVSNNSPLTLAVGLGKITQAGDTGTAKAVSILGEEEYESEARIYDQKWETLPSLKSCYKALNGTA